MFYCFVLFCFLFLDFNVTGFGFFLGFRYLSLGSSRNRELTRKMHTMYQSVLKVEKVCYNVKVRGSEAAIWSSSDAHAHEKETDDTDEGFVHY